MSKGREELGIGLIYLSLKEIEARGEVGYGIVLKCIVGGFVGLISDDSTKKIHLFLNVLIEKRGAARGGYCQVRNKLFCC